MPGSISGKLAEFIVETDYAQLPSEAVEAAKRCFLDWLGSAIAGSLERPTRIMLEVVKELGGEPEATLIPDGSRSSPFLAALVNAASSHVLEMDDLHPSSILHPGAPVIPTALAMAEREGCSGEEFLTALVIGYEVAIRVGEAAGPSHYEYWHTTATCGTFGAAAAAGKLLGLKGEQLVSALGSAGTQAAGLWEFLKDGAMSKQLHPAKAAADGILSALLAEKGFTAAKGIFEGEKGFLRATSKAFDLEKLTRGLGEGFRITETSFKVHAACYHTHSSIDAALTLRGEHRFPPEQIKKVLVRPYPAALDLLEKVELSGPYAAKFHLPFCVATALIYGEVGLEAFSEERLKDPVILQLLPKIELRREEAFAGVYPEKWPSIVEVTVEGGETYQATVEYAKGDFRNPLTWEELSTKFHRLAGRVAPPERRSLLLEKIWKLDQLPNMAAFFEGGGSSDA